METTGSDIYDAVFKEQQSEDIREGEVNSKVKNTLVKINHTVMGVAIAAIKVFRSYFPITLIIGKSEVGKSSLVSVLGTNPETTTIFTEWTEVIDHVEKERDELKSQEHTWIKIDKEIAKPMHLIREDNKGVESRTNTTENRPRSEKYNNLIEANFDKIVILNQVIKPAIDAMIEFKDAGVNKTFKPGAIPIVYYNESLRDAIFYHDVFFLIVVEGQESGGSRHRITLQVRNEWKPVKPTKTDKKRKRVIGDRYRQDPTFGVKHITCFPVDLMIYFSLLGPVRVTSVNSSTFSSKGVVSNTQKGGLSDSVINTPNYVSNVIGQWGGSMIIEIRDDWDKADTLFGAGDMAIEVSKIGTSASTVANFRLRNGELEKDEFHAIKRLYKLIVLFTLRCLSDDLQDDLDILTSIVKFMDAFVAYSDSESDRVQNYIHSAVKVEKDPDTMNEILSSIEDYIVICSRRDLTVEGTLFSEIKEIYAR